MASKPMTVTVTDATDLVSSLPVRVRRRAGLKLGDQVELKAVRGVVTITAKLVEPTYKPTKAEAAAIRKGRAEIARGEYVTLNELLYDLDRNRRKVGAKTTPHTPA